MEKNEVAKNGIAKRGLNPVQAYMKQNNTMKQLQGLMQKRSTSFMVSLNNAFEDYLVACTPESVVKSAMTAAALNLPIEKNLGFAYLIPYKNNKTGITVCNFQLGYKGLIQLAQRTGKYKAINSIPIYAEQFLEWNPLTEEIKLDFSTEVDYFQQPVGFCAYFKLLNGFEKTLYWPIEKCEAHSRQYSPAFRGFEKETVKWKKESSIWGSNTNEMHAKTVLKQIISKYGPLSVEMQTAAAEEREIKNAEVEVHKEIENKANKEFIDMETGEIKEVKPAAVPAKEGPNF